MSSKYDYIMENVYQYIANHVELKVEPEVIAVEVVNRFPTFTRFYDVSAKMQLEIARSLAEQSWYNRWEDYKYDGKKVISGSVG